MRTTPVNRGVRRGFTLVEMLVVITIIGILAGLAIPAVIVARNRAKITAVSMDIKQLEMACQNYKEKFGEYPPDFAFVGNPFGAIGPPAQQIVLRHLAKAFPRYTPGCTGDWPGFINDLTAVGILPPHPVAGNIGTSLSPQTALAFWLGGVPDPNNNFLPSGFGADPAHPFSLPSTPPAALGLTGPVCPSRINPFFDFDSTRLRNAYQPAGTTVAQTFTPCSWLYWPQGADGDHSSGAITYFRAENGVYSVTILHGGFPQNIPKYLPQDAGDTGIPPGVVFPAIDTRISTIANYSFVNPRSIQIFSAGLDTRFGALQQPASGVPGAGTNVLEFPTGENYQPFTYDDITNFSGGKLEDAIP